MNSSSSFQLLNYYPYGMQMAGRNGQIESYRYMFNGMEQDMEVSGQGNSYTTMFRQYDPRLGRFKSLDPLAKQFVHNSPFAYAENRVVDGIDLEGLETYYTGDGRVFIAHLNGDQSVRIMNDYIMTQDMINLMKAKIDAANQDVGEIGIAAREALRKELSNESKIAIMRNGLAEVDYNAGFEFKLPPSDRLKKSRPLYGDPSLPPKPFKDEDFENKYQEWKRKTFPDGYIKGEGAPKDANDLERYLRDLFRLGLNHNGFVVTSSDPEEKRSVNGDADKLDGIKLRSKDLSEGTTVRLETFPLGNGKFVEKTTTKVKTRDSIHTTTERYWFKRKKDSSGNDIPNSKDTLDHRKTKKSKKKRPKFEP